MTSCIEFLISMYGTRMCGQTLLFIVIANCDIESVSITALLIGPVENCPISSQVIIIIISGFVFKVLRLSRTPG